MENQELKEFPFWIFFLGKKNKIKTKFFSYFHIFEPLCPNLDKNEFSAKIGLRHFLGFIVA